MARHLVPAIALGAFFFSPAHAALQFTDWTSASTVTDIASGNVGAVTVTLAGTAINGANLSGTSTFFAEAGTFTPALAASDHLELAGLNPASTFTVSFSQVVVNPVIHLADLSSLITFGSGTLTRLSGSSSLTTSGNAIPCSTSSGSFACKGTVQLVGLFSSLSFTALNPGGGEGFYFQIGFDPLAPVPEPAAWGLAAVGLGWVAARARRRG